jgi:hypothetical protein
MKLRIHGDSLRLRLSPSEIDTLMGAGRIEETIHFGLDQKLVYALVLTDEENRISASLIENAITVVMPRQWAVEWAETEKVGFETTQSVGKDGTLRILVEKDFHFIRRRLT